MDSRWFKGLDEEAKDKRKKELSAAKHYFELAIEVLEKDFSEYSPDYSNSAWAYEQADVNGANRKLRQVIKLLTIKD